MQATTKENDLRVRITADGEKIYIIRRKKVSLLPLRPDSVIVPTETKVEVHNIEEKIHVSPSTLIDFPKVNHIELFFSKGSSRANNDSENKIRESILKNILTENCFDEYFADANYGLKWNELKQKWNDCLISLCPVLFSSLKVIQKAGRTFNYDFLVVYYDENENILCEKNIEFKHNVSSISKLPQFLSLPDKISNFISHKYAEFYYDNYIDKYIEQDEELESIKKMEKEQYLKIIGNIKYNIHPLFQKMYDNEG